MTTCREITELATLRAEGAIDPAAGRSFEDHVAACAGCRAYLRQLDLVHRALRALPPPKLTGEQRESLLRQFDAWHARRAGEPAAPVAALPAAGRRFPWEAFFVLAGAAGMVVGLARDPSHALEDWALASALAAGAVVLAAVARRLTGRFALLAASAAFVAAAIGGGPGPLAVAQGVECLLTEATVAAVAAGGAWLSARRVPAPVALGVWAVAGALAADGALQVGCGMAASLAHLAAFHAGGVLALALALWLVARAWPRPHARASRG